MQVVCALVTFVAALASQMPADGNTATVAVNVTVAARTSLHASAKALQFVVPEGSTTATASVEFTAAARVPQGTEVVLNVESPRGVDGPGGAAEVDGAVTFDGRGEGTQSGVIENGMSVAGRWQGSGRRTGRLTFTLHASAPGTYTLLLELSLTLQEQFP
jgi:hypothetical protein